MEPEVTPQAPSVEAPETPAAPVVEDIGVSLDWNGEMSTLDPLLERVPDQAVRDALRRGLDEKRKSMERTFYEKTAYVANLRKQAVASLTAAEEEVKQAREAAKAWVTAQDAEDVAEIVNALDRYASLSIEEARAERDAAIARAEQAEATREAIASSLRKVFEEQYATKLAELEPLAARARELEAEQARLRAEREAEQEAAQKEAILADLVAAVERSGGQLPDQERDFDVVAEQIRAAAAAISKVKGELAADAAPEVADARWQEILARVGKQYAAIHPKAAPAPAPAAPPPNPNAPKPAPAAEALASQARSGSGADVPTGPRPPKVRFSAA